MLSAESLKQIDFELAKYPKEQNRSAIMGALRIAQVELGYLSVETIVCGHSCGASLGSGHFLQHV